MPTTRRQSAGLKQPVELSSLSPSSSSSSSSSSSAPKHELGKVKTIAFVHPDLGIGGAERLIVDAAVALQSRGWKVTMYTAHCSPDHCFPETQPGRKDSLDVRVHGDFLPRSLFGTGRMMAFFAYLRVLYVSLVILLSCLLRWTRFDIVCGDQVSITIPLLKWVAKKVVFYCHFPDKMLTTRKSFLKRIYRAPLDFLEEYTTGCSDLVWVNSRFTLSVFEANFTRIFEPLQRGGKLKVLHPGVSLSDLDGSHPSSLLRTAENTRFFLSLNRFERKKNIPLVLHAFLKLIKEMTAKGENVDDMHLVLAGGYDKDLPENAEVVQELRRIIAKHNGSESAGVEDRVTFFLSCSNEEKACLLQGCEAVVYTPENEHFGIVPVEGMYCARPVIAVNSGGPMESVVDGVTGYLCQPDVHSFCKAMAKVLSSDDNSMGDAGRQRVVDLFSRDAFGSHFHGDLIELLDGTR
eukprot:TRINITY_DN904_c0_g1_i1.p1 TRINITY_DN904_c0_g1~~TRINITY_DN904_c0_g1_i1.p1  ORF type:complete len:463 (-),score=111.36 TRINITY_DN904_c0_g1_i1:2-1390(-)